MIFFVEEAAKDSKANMLTLNVGVKFIKRNKYE